MIGCHQEQIIRPQVLHQLPEPFIKGFHLPGVSRHIAPVAPFRVEIHEVREHHPREVPLCQINGLLHALHRGIGVDRLGDAFAVKNVPDLPHGNHLEPRILQAVQHGAAKGLQGIVAAVGRPHELPRFLPHIGPRNDPSDFPLGFHGQPPGDLAAPVQLLESERLLIAADLQDGIRRCVDNHVPRGDFLRRQFFQDLSP